MNICRNLSVRTAFGALGAFILSVACFGQASADPNNITVARAWSRPASDTGVVYVTIHNAGVRSDRLLGAASPVARHVELHESVEHSMQSSMPGMGMTGMSLMREVSSVTVPAHGTVTFKPGGYHVMLVGLTHPLIAGETFPVRFRFAGAGEVTATATVRGAGQ
ncbi:MAG: copper chaperone PCu(A)C [Vulcanimicrobiaceae bacterium]